MRHYVEDMKTGCDFCVAGVVEWTFRLPRDTVTMATQDLVTGKVTILKSNGFMGACEGCKDAILSGASAHATLARRVFRVNPLLSAMTGVAKIRSFKASVKNYKRLLRHFKPDPRPYVPNEDPLEGLALWTDTEDGPEGNDLN